MIPRPRRLLLLFPFLAALACSSATAPAGTVTAAATVTGILVRNGTTAPIFYLAAEAGTLALLDFLPCSDAARCPNIAPGEEKGLRWDQVVGYAPDLHSYVLLWWQAPNANADAKGGRVVIHR
ncbi:MAG TPA: hypothetical protein VFI52_11175 [Gemmatimonadaceae bacterium]|nr:hypothetical protein [Gemmatimonadaceae bacterium]